ncbi:MAG: cytochrome P450, partial [Myxococcota bacterium]
QSFAWIPFGAGRHRCVGAAFAMMQLKAIFSILLRRWEFELAQPRESYANDFSKMVVAVQQPCVVRYRRRASAASVASVGARAGERSAPASGPLRIRIDLDLCQGHAVCMGEAPEVFAVERNADGEDKAVLRSREVPGEQRAQVEAAVRHCPTRALTIEE